MYSRTRPRHPARRHRRPVMVACTGALVGLLFCPMLALPQQNAEALATATHLVRAGQYDSALALLTRELHEHPNDARLRTIAGLAYSLKGDDASALLSLRAALKSSPGFAPAFRPKRKSWCGTTIRLPSRF